MSITWCVGVSLVVQAAPGHRLAAEQRVTVQVVAELLQEAQDVGDAADRGQGQRVLLLLEVGCRGQRSKGSKGQRGMRQRTERVTELAPLTWSG